MKLASAVVSVLIQTTHAALCESIDVSGEAVGEKISNFNEITRMGASNYEFASFSTCTDDNGDVIGTQYTLRDSNDITTDLTAIGSMTGSNCQSLALSGPIEKIRASYSSATSSVSSIRYLRGEA